MKTHRAPRRNGSALAITLILALALLVAGGSYVSLTTSTRKVTEANFTQHALQSALERGVDEAMYAFGKYRDGGFLPAQWKSLAWTQNGTGYSKNLGSVQLGNGRSANLKVTIQELPSDNKGKDSSGKLVYPYIIAEAAFSPGSGDASSAYSRQVLAVLSPSTGNSFTGGPGMSTKGPMIFNGSDANMTFDSYDSAAGIYGAGNRKDTITVATATAYAAGGADPIAGSATVYGYAYVGGKQTTQTEADALVAFSGFHVYGADSDSAYKTAGLDPQRVGSGFSANFTIPAITIPAGITPIALGAVKNEQTITGSDNPYKPNYFTASSISLSGSETLTVKGYAVIIMSGDIALAGSASIKLINESSTTTGTPATITNLKIYTSYDADLGGDGVANAALSGTAKAASSLTTNFYIYGTNSTGAQSIKIAGNGAFSGVIFAPNADVTFAGGGSSGVYYGSLTAKSVTVNGKVYFHYDEQLGPGGPTTTISGYSVSSWVEPTTKTKMSAYGL